jgi:hypothetical protein
VKVLLQYVWDGSALGNSRRVERIPLKSAARGQAEGPRNRAGPGAMIGHDGVDEDPRSARSAS